MKLEDQVCTLEQAKRLDELLKVDVDSVFTWGLHIRNEDYAWEVGMSGYKDHGNALQSYPAYTVAELGEMLPGTVTFNKTQKATLRMVKYGNVFGLNYTRNSSGHTIVCRDGNSEAQARAAMLIYLLENNLLTN